jgi:hypothetical protein
MQHDVPFTETKTAFLCIIRTILFILWVYLETQTLNGTDYHDNSIVCSSRTGSADALQTKHI